MPYFPAFLNIDNENVLVVGAGNVAARKIEKLLPFNCNIKVVAIQANEEVQEMNSNNELIHLELRKFNFNDLDNKKLVIVAIDDIPLQKEVFDVCEKNNQMCNCVDSPDYCNFIFPALVTRGDLTVGINTAGKAPYVSSRVRKLLDTYLPEKLSDVVEKSYEFRESLPDRKQASEQIKQFVDKLFSQIK